MGACCVADLPPLLQVPGPWGASNRRRIRSGGVVALYRPLFRTEVAFDSGLK